MKINKLIDFKFLKDILYYDGPIISLGLTNDNLPVFEIWCDENKENNINIYAYVFITHNDFQLFINFYKSYFNVIKDSLEIVLFKYNGEAFDFQIVSNEKFITNYGPQDDSDSCLDLINFRNHYLKFNEKE